jgi:Ca2+-transporting ATPase
MSVEETFHLLETRPEGLSEEDSNRRIGAFGLNEIEDGRRFSQLRLLLAQFKSPLIFILIIAGTVTAFLKDWLDTGIIFAAVFVNVVLGFYQENKAENVLELLKSYVKTRTRVRRENAESIIDASRLVPGDVIRIRQGDKIPADGRVVFASNLEVDEAVLTGESIPVVKKIEPVEMGVSIGDRASMVFVVLLM